MIQIKGISKTFYSPSPLKVLDNIEFGAKKGEFISIVGKSGCGKTTLLRIIGNLEKADKGLINFGSKKPNFGFVFQKPALLEWRNVERNIALPNEILGNGGFNASALLKLVGLEEFASFPPGQLSGGMKQKISLARTLSTNPDILLMDEPFASIDSMSREFLALELQDIWRKSKKTVLFVTHQLEEAIFLADRVIVLSNRPAKVKKIVRIDLARPRHPDIKHTAKFQRYVKCIKKLLAQ